MTYPTSRQFLVTPTPQIDPKKTPINSIPAATSQSWPASWSGDTMTNWFVGYDEASDYMVFGGQNAIDNEVQMVALGPMSSDTPSFGTVYNVPSSTGHVIKWMSPTGRLFAMTDDSLRRITISSGTIQNPQTISSMEINYVNQHLNGPLGEFLVYESGDVSSDIEYVKLNATSHDTVVDVDLYLTASGNSKYVQLDNTNTLRFITAFGTSPTYSTGISATARTAMNYGNFRKEVVLSNVGSTRNFSFDAYTITGSEPVASHTNTFDRTVSDLTLRKVTYNTYLDRYFYYASNSTSTYLSEVGVVQHKDGGIVLETTMGTNPDTSAVASRQISAGGKWLCVMDSNVVSGNFNTAVKLYKLI